MQWLLMSITNRQAALTAGSQLEAIFLKDSLSSTSTSFSNHINVAGRFVNHKHAAAG